MSYYTKKWTEYFLELWNSHKLLIIFLAGALLFDTLTTIHFMTTDGIDLEIHPLIRHSALLLGPVVGTVLSAFVYKIVASLFLAIYLRQLRLWILILPTISSTCAGVINLSL